MAQFTRRKLLHLSASAVAWPVLAKFHSLAAPWRRKVKITDITKGSSNQILIGEKFVRTDLYNNSGDGGDNECAYTGMNNDVNICRKAGFSWPQPWRMRVKKASDCSMSTTDWRLRRPRAKPP
jgi:hypothetical protein